MTTQSRVYVALEELPGGTVTFLFTDIQGSTQLLHQLRDQYATLLEEHHQIIRSAVERWHGREVDTQGDAFFVAFPKATEAIAATAEIQQTLKKHTWPEDVQVQVRMGLHTGEPWLAGEGYVGMDVHRAARIAHVGHGGQVLLSETTAALVMDELPDGVALLDLGRHLLKDMHRPEHIRQLDIVGLPGKFPPLTSLATVPDASERPIHVVGDCPYRGLAAFREPDAPFYFGREVFVDTLEKAIGQQPMVAIIVGASGSGKSSAIFAGLLPRLKKEAGWLLASLRPGAQPFHALASALLPYLEPGLSESDRLIESGKLARGLVEGDTNLVNILDRILEKEASVQRLLLVLDQFEELYALCPDEELQHQFVDQLLAVVDAGQKRGQLSKILLLTMRADFMGQALAYRPFVDALQEASLLMGPMNREELRSAVESPAEKQGAAFEPGLVERILDDVGAKPGNLPLLEFTLTQLWQAQTDGWLTHDDYEALGGVEGALASYAEDVYGELSPEQQEGVRRALIQMVRPGEGTEDTRRVATREELGGKNWDLVRHLADKRLVVTGQDAQGRQIAEVVHEALIQRWDRFRGWMGSDRAFRAWQERLRANLQQWRESDEDQGALLSGGPLSVAIDWLEERKVDLSRSETAYIQTSQDYQKQLEVKRAQRRQRELEAAQALAESEGRRAEEQASSATKIRRIARLLAVLAVVAALLTLSAILLFRQARQNEQLATSRELAAAAINNLEADPELSVLLAIEAMAVADTREAQNALHQSLPALHLVHTFSAHDSTIGAMALSPDGKILATGSQDHTLKIWDMENGRQMLNLEFPGAAVSALAFSPDGQHLASAGFAMPFNIWELSPRSDGENLAARALITITSQTEPVLALTFSPNGAMLASSDNAAVVRIWDPENGQEMFTLAGHEPTPAVATIGLFGVKGVAFSPDGQILATAGNDGTTRLWDTRTGEALLVLPSHSQAARSVAFDPTGTHLVTAGEEGSAKVWTLSPGGNTADNQLVISQPDGLNAAVFNPDGSTLATAGMDGKVKIWDAHSGRELLDLSGHTGSVLLASFTPNGEKLVTTSEDSTARIWDTNPGRELLVLTPGTSPTYSLDGQLLATGNANGTITIRDSNSGKTLLTLPGHDDTVVAADFSPDGSQLASASVDGTARVWDVISGHELFDLDGHQERLWDITYNSDGTLLATASNDHTIKIWDANTGLEQLSLVASDAAIFSVDFSPDGLRLVSGNWGEAEGDSIKLWDMATGEMLWRVPIEAGAFDVAFDPAGEHLATSDRAGQMTLWDVTNDKPQILFTFDGHTSSVIDVEFSQDGMRLASASFDGTARVWDAATGQELLTLAAQSDPLVRVAFNPDGDRLATASMNLITHVYILNPGELVDLAKERVTRTLTPQECLRFLHQESCP